jgi:hypothetical protein
VLKATARGRILLWSGRGGPLRSNRFDSPDDDLPLGKHIVWGDEAKPPVLATVADGFAVWATGEATAVRLGNFLFWLCIIIAGAWLLLAHNMGVDQDSRVMVYGGAGIALAVGWALRYIARRRLG